MNAGLTASGTTTLATIFAGLGAVVPVPDLAVRGLAVDSRRVKSGDCFFALRGARTHGLTFIEQAIQNGATAVGIDSAEQPIVVPVPVVRVARLRG